MASPAPGYTGSEMSVRSAIGLRSIGVLKMITGHSILLVNNTDTREGSEFDLELYIGKFNDNKTEVPSHLVLQ